MADKKLIDTIQSRHHSAERLLAEKRTKWNDLEDLLHGTLSDSLSSTAKSKVFDPKLATFLIERSGRVMSQLPTGKVKPMSRNDVAASELMNLCLDKYVIPNANAQFDFLTKLRLMDLYSNVYGNYFAMVDWDIKPNGYAGPDLFLIDIWDIFPQVGAVSLEDSDYVIVRTWKTISQIEQLGERSTYRNIDAVVRKLKDSSDDKSSRDSDKESSRTRDEYGNREPSKGDGYYEVLTMYEKDRWVDYVPRAEMIIREIDNPHDNGELPLVNKYSIPLMHDFFGLSDFERGMSMQKGLNSLWNLYLDGVKMSIFPPMELDKNNIYASTIKFGPAEKWLVKRIGSARAVDLSPQGINSFNNTYQTMNAALLNMHGTTDTSVSSSTEAGFGKTPLALKLQAQRENTRDNLDRFYMEKTVEAVMGKMVNLISKKQSGAIKMRLFEDEVQSLAQRFPEIEEYYDEENGQVTIDREVYGDVMFDYEIVSGSTHAVDQDKQLQALIQMLQVLPQTEEKMTAEGKKVNYGELVTRIMNNAGITDWDKIIQEQSEDDLEEQELQAQQEELMMALQQSAGIGGVPPQPQQAPLQQGYGQETTQQI